MNLHKLISSSKDTSGDFIDMDVNAEWDKFQKKIGYTAETKKAKQTPDRSIIRYAVAASIVGIGVLIFILLSNNKKIVHPEALQESSDLVIHQTLPAHLFYPNRHGSAVFPHSGPGRSRTYI